MGKPREGKAGGGQPSLTLQTKRDIGERIRHCYRLIAADRTWQRFAGRLGVPRTTITAWIGNPPTAPSTAHVVAFAERMNVSPSWLLLGVGPELLGSSLPHVELSRAFEEAVRAHLVARGHDTSMVAEFLRQGPIAKPPLERSLRSEELWYESWRAERLSPLRERQFDEDRRVVGRFFRMSDEDSKAVPEGKGDGSPPEGMWIPEATFREAAAALERLLTIPAPPRITVTDVRARRSRTKGPRAPRT